MISFVSYAPSLLSRLVSFWNTVFQERRHFSPITLEAYQKRIVAQPTFDPQGLVLALAGGAVAGLVHAIKPVPPDLFIYRARRCRDNGSIAALAVAPKWRGKGIGSALLARAEEYLAKHLKPGGLTYVGDYDLPLYHTLEGPRQPFWGDTETMGVEENDSEFIRFLTRRGYTPAPREGQEVTMAASVGQPREPVSPPLGTFGLEEVTLSDTKPWPGRVAWFPDKELQEYSYPLSGDAPYRVIALARDGTIMSHIQWYPMRQPGYAALWDLLVAESDRGHGLGRYLLDKGLWMMARQGYHTVELHTHTQKNALAYRIYLRRGFQVVVRWVTLQKEGSKPSWISA
ncbi:MAG: GNAT family N-acetyltransferase [Anaerolineae bacterium]|nr:GNAT family N-acetyltransferase [Anaerolineae bacterium]